MVAARKLDPTIYPETDRVGEGELQQLIDELFRPLLARFLASQQQTAHVGSNTFLYYRKHDSSSRIAPDIYVLPGVPQARIGRSWKLWELARPPAFALEVVSLDVDKDYIEAPAIHERIGTEELVVFDPDASGQKERVRWQVFGRARGAMRLVQRSNADRVASRALGAFLRVVGTGDGQRVRIGTGPRGGALFPTEAEAERADKERERADKERERADKERERDARRAAERENAALREEIARLRAGKPAPRRRRGP